MVPRMRRVFITVFPTALGWMAGAWRAERLLGIAFNHPDPQAAMAALVSAFPNLQHPIVPSGHADDEPTEGQAALISRLQAFTTGRRDDFLDVSLEVSELTPFQRQVIHHCRRIPAGELLSYGQLAEKAGSPGAARAVGQVMRTNRWPLVVPCHRVIASGGRLGGYSAPEGLALKRRLLELEGVALLP